MAIEAQYKKLIGNQEEGWPSTLAYLQQQLEVPLSPGVRSLSQRVSGVLDYELDRLGDWLGTPEFDRLLVEAIWGEEESVHRGSDAGGAELPGGTDRPGGGEQHYESLTVEAVEAGAAQEEVGTAFSSYRPTRVNVKDAQKHPANLVESTAMATVSPPTPTYRPTLPPEVVTEGRLQEMTVTGSEPPAAVAVLPGVPRRQYHRPTCAQTPRQPARARTQAGPARPAQWPHPSTAPSARAPRGGIPARCAATRPQASHPPPAPPPPGPWRCVQRGGPGAGSPDLTSIL